MDFGEEDMGDIPTRPMRVKISYTFDQNNCLARIQDVMNIPVVPIDELGTSVGVIDLQPCINAITVASPELVSRLSEGDFTIYAFDYSEPDTPLVGQGALSAALNASQPTQQSQSKIIGRVCKNAMAMFKNGPKETLEVKLRLVPLSRPAQMDFSRSMDNLRSASPAMSSGFDPNAWNTSMQQNRMQQQTNDYFNFDGARSSDDRDMKLVDDIFGFVSSGDGGLHQAGGVGIPETPSDPTLAFNPAFSHSAPGSRAGSPMMVSESSSHNPALRHQSFSGHPSNLEDPSRPGSRASVRSEVGSRQQQHQRQASTQSLPPQQPLQTETEVYYNEDGQSRKRAKVVQADWRGKSSFGSKSGDLRVNAATAASMHMHRPIPKRPNAPGSNLEPPPRVPTPVPQMNRALSQQQQTQQLNPRRSMLRQASTAGSDFMSDVDNFSDALMSSPEEESPGNSITAEGTPRDIPSSPPVFPGINLPQPSSPGLPTLPPPRLADSGYMSERNIMSGNIIDTMENDEDRSPDAQDYEVAAQYKARNGRQQSQPLVKIEGSEAARPMPPLFDESTQMGNGSMSFHDAGDPTMTQGFGEGSQGLARVSSVPAKRPASTQTTSPDFAASMQQASRAAMMAQTPFDQSQSRRGSLALPPNPTAPSSDLPNAAPQPAAKSWPPIHRSRTTSNESEAGSPAPSDTEGGKPKGPKRSGTGASRRKVIADRLQKNIENGQPINFCFHCGAIETPTWRRIYIKECEGIPTGLDSHEGEGETIGVEVLKDKDTGESLNKFVIRKSMKKTKENPIGEDFEGKQVCNPCGLWFNKFRTMRPEAKWNRKAGTRNRKKQKDGGDAGPATDGPELYSEAPFFTDQVGPDEDSLEDAEMAIDPQLDAPAINPRPATWGRPRANSMQAQQQRPAVGGRSKTTSQLGATMAREVQSSPVRGFNGSQQSPIEIEDVTPKPTRRLLFPSPRQRGEIKSLGDHGQAAIKSSISAGGEIEGPIAVVKTAVSLKPGIDLAFDHASDTNIFEAFTFDKENLAPGSLEVTYDDDLAHLFEGSPSMVFKTPRKTPAKNVTTPRSMRQLSHLLKTPTPGSRKRIPLTPNQNAANTGAGGMVVQQAINDFMTSPSSTRYFLRSTPSRLERTPGGRNAINSSDPNSDNNNGSPEISPWSRHLAQMLSDANDGGSAGMEGLTSPSQRQFGDFSDLPTFTTPGRIGLDSCDWEGLELEGLLGSYDSEGSGEGRVEGELE